MAKGKAQKKHNDSEKLNLVTEICKNYGTGKYTIESCCENVGIVWGTFHIWITENSTLGEIYKTSKETAKKERTKNLVNLALKEIEKRINGYTETEETVEGKNENGAFIATKVIRKKVRIKASDSLLMFVGKNSLNIDADATLTDIQKVEHTGEIDINHTIIGMQIIDDATT